MSTFGVLEEGKEFWTHLEDGELYIQQCKSCGVYVFYPKPMCPNDLGELTYVKASGKGKVLTYSVIFNTPDPRMKESLPAIVGVVKLDEGPTMYAQIVADQTEDLFNKDVEFFADDFAGRKTAKFKLA